MKTILPLLFLLCNFNFNAQLSCNQTIYPPENDPSGGIYHVHNDSTINDQNGGIYYICSGVHLTVDYSAGSLYQMEKQQPTNY